MFFPPNNLRIVGSETFHVLLENPAWRILSRPPGILFQLMRAQQRHDNANSQSFPLPNAAKGVFTSKTPYTKVNQPRSLHLHLFFLKSILTHSSHQRTGLPRGILSVGLVVDQISKEIYIGEHGEESSRYQESA